MFKEQPAQTSIQAFSQSIAGPAMILMFVFATPAAQAQHSIDGAIWRFTMKPLTPNLQVLKGQFRVSNHRLFQKEKPESNEFNKPVGSNNPRNDRTVMTLTNLRAIDRNRKWHDGFQGKVLLRFERFGYWTGRFIDSKGRHWEFSCTRVQD